MDIKLEIEKIIKFALDKEMIDIWDVIPVRNSLLELLKIESPYNGDREEIGKISYKTPVEILKNILDYAAEYKIIEEDTVTYRDLLDAKIMGLLMPRQSEIINRFDKIKLNESLEAATDWFYDLSKSANYIMTERINKNLYWLSGTEYGDLEITVNLSKPEKDPKEIAKSKLVKQSNYPKCLLCIDNVGYAGRLNHPARQNHRVIPLKLQDTQWFLQYSPYVYYSEHCIVFKGDHEAMKIGRDALERLVEFTDKFPHYFIGSNADLPIVGGSILTHDHYQGGKHNFPMEKAPIEKVYISNKFSEVEIGTVKWPMTVIRLKSLKKDSLVELAVTILDKWKNYNDEENEIQAFTDDTPHNTITPIARRKGKYFELDIVLRNNRTSEEHPDGIFHPHKELHHIKKENIGLIEVMGLAVLPGRLEKELEAVTKLVSGYEIDDSIDLSKHENWIIKIKNQYKDLTIDDARELVRTQVGEIFSKVLENSGVFKRGIKGQLGLEKFIKEII